MSDLRETMKGFEYEPKKGELEDMIWEVDETMDKTVSYLEFSITYRRYVCMYECCSPYVCKHV